MNKKNMIVMCLSVLLLTQAACSLTDKNPVETTGSITETTKSTESITTTITTVEPEQGTDEKAIMNAFEELTKKVDITLKDLTEYATENIEKISADNASKMVLAMEDRMKEHLSEMEDVFYTQTVQEKFQNVISEDINLNDPDSFEDSAIKELIQETKEKGYKVEQAEGSFFPVIDYSYLKRFNEYATPEIRDYIDIMSVESENAFAKDAGLLIGWDEVVSRALTQEKYLNEYKRSEKAEDISILYKRYVYIALNGIDNTPLFDYETKIMKEEAKSAYEDAIKDSTESELLKILSDFLELLQKNQYKFSDEVEKYRKDCIESILAS